MSELPSDTGHGRWVIQLALYLFGGAALLGAGGCALRAFEGASSAIQRRLLFTALGLAIVACVFASAQLLHTMRDLRRQRARVCTKCRYPLDRLPEAGRCPECGGAYRHDDPAAQWARALSALWPFRRSD